MRTRSEFIKELFPYLTDFMYVTFYINTRAGIYIFNTFFFCISFTVLLITNTLVWESKHSPSFLCMISAMKREKFLYYAPCRAICLETPVLFLIQCFCIFWNKQKGKKENRKEWRNSSSFFNWKQCTNCSIWLHWHLFIVYCSFGDESHDSLVQNALILLYRRTDKKAHISQGFSSALCWASLRVSLTCSHKRNVPRNRVTQCPHQNCQCHQIKSLCRLGLILLGFPHLIEGIYLLSTSILKEEN